MMEFSERSTIRLTPYRRRHSGLSVGEVISFTADTTILCARSDWMPPKCSDLFHLWSVRSDSRSLAC